MLTESTLISKNLSENYRKMFGNDSFDHFRGEERELKR